MFSSIYQGYFRFPIVPAAAANIQPAASLLLPRRIDEAHCQKAVAALTLPAARPIVIVLDDSMPGFGYRLRLGAGGKINALMGRASIAMAVPPVGCCSARPTVLGAEQARAMAKKALGRVANGEDPQADKLDRRGKDRHTLKATVADYLAIKQREVRPRTYTELARYLTDKRYFGPLHSLALDQITRKDVATRLNRISLESSSIVAARARAQLQRAVQLGAGAWPVRSQPGGRHARSRRAASRASACCRTPSWPQSGRRAVTTIMAAASSS